MMQSAPFVQNVFLNTTMGGIGALNLLLFVATQNVLRGKEPQIIYGFFKKIILMNIFAPEMNICDVYLI